MSLTQLVGTMHNICKVRVQTLTAKKKKLIATVKMFDEKNSQEVLFYIFPQNPFFYLKNFLKILIDIWYQREYLF